MNELKAKSVTELPNQVASLVSTAHQEHQRIVLVTGVFDLLHQEHEIFLRKAKEEGDILLVGIESDPRVRRTKGEGRPVNPEDKRLTNLADWKIADCVFILPDEFDTPDQRRAFIHTVRPSILAVSAHSPFLEAKQALLSEVGGEVKVVHEHNPTVSTTILLEKIDKIDE
jgi:D-beta-D-heptose 7-phosphate kinase/D-beta-D-heptose 1-phosphate adenosyltransferase